MINIKKSAERNKRDFCGFAILILEYWMMKIRKVKHRLLVMALNLRNKFSSLSELKVF